MEKFSAYRDPSTGIQPFLTPVPHAGSKSFEKVILPVRYVSGVVRTVLVLLLLPTYLVLIHGLCLIFTPVPPLCRVMRHFFTSIIARAVLLLVGLVWIPVEQVTRKRGRVSKPTESWNPQARDVIVSNWVSWIEILWLAYRFNPIFVLPISEPVQISGIPQSQPIAITPGRRTGTGSANIQSPRKINIARVPITGFRTVSLLGMIQLTGEVPPFGTPPSSSLRGTLDDIRKAADRPIVVFPECTTSNGRGLLRFSDIFHQDVPVKDYNVFIMCVRFDPPTNLVPTLTHSIPSPVLNPLPHIFSLATSLVPPAISIRLLAPSESPGSRLFIASDIVTGRDGEDQLAETSAVLISQVGKLKRIGVGWEEKTSFLKFYWGKLN